MIGTPLFAIHFGDTDPLALVIGSCALVVSIVAVWLMLLDSRRNNKLFRVARRSKKRTILLLTRRALRSPKFPTEPLSTPPRLIMGDA